MSLFLLKILFGSIMLQIGFQQRLYPGYERKEDGFVSSFKFPRKHYTYLEYSADASPHFLNDKNIIHKDEFRGINRDEFPYLWEATAIILPLEHPSKIYLYSDQPTTLTVNGNTHFLSAKGSSTNQQTEHYQIGDISNVQDTLKITLLQLRRGYRIKPKVEFRVVTGYARERMLKPVEVFPPFTKIDSWRTHYTQRFASPFLLILHILFIIWVILFVIFSRDWTPFAVIYRVDPYLFFAFMIIPLLIVIYPMKRAYLHPGIPFFVAVAAGCIVCVFILYRIETCEDRQLWIDIFSRYRKSLRLFLRGLLWFILSWKGAQLFLALYGRGAVLYDEGIDALGFETLAREIVFRDVLNHSEAPFWHQPLYRWFVALFHVLLGDSVVWVFIAQFVIYVLSVLIIYRLAVRLFSRGTGIAIIIVMISAIFGLKYYYWISSGYPCIMGQFLLAGGIYATVSWIQATKKIYRAFLSGLILGLAILTRTNFVFILPGIVLWGIGFWIYRPQNSSLHKGLMLLLFGILLMIGLCGFRNWILSNPHRFVLFIDPRNANNILKSALPPPEGFQPDNISKVRFYNRLGLPINIRAYLEIWRHNPGYAFSYVIDRALVILGFPGHFEAFNRRSYPKSNPLLLLLWGLAILGFVIFRRSWWRAETSFIFSFMGMLIISVLILGLNTSNYRLVVPVYTLLLVFPAEFIYRAIRWVRIFAKISHRHGRD